MLGKNLTGLLGALLLGFVLHSLANAQPLIPSPSADRIQTRGIYFGDMPAKWKNGLITWKYNPANRPATLTDQQVLDALKLGFSWWSNTCQITATYGGLTDTNVNASRYDEVVIGFNDTGVDSDTVGGGADASPISNDTASNFAFYTGGVIRIGTMGAKNFLNNTYVVAHEIGHLLGFNHSDDPASILYANPYFVISDGGYQISHYVPGTPGPLFGDDIETCANLYGGRGFFRVNDFSQLSPNTSLGFFGEISVTKPGFTPVPYGKSQIDTTVDNYFVLRWTGQNPASLITLRLVMPNGSIYNGFEGKAESANALNYITKAANSWPLAGAWQFQGLVDGKLAFLQYFTVAQGLVSKPPKLEYAAIVEQNGGTVAQRIVDYSTVATSYINAYLNDNYSAVGSNFTPRAGKNVLEFWAKSVLPRYAADYPNNIGGQNLNSADAIKQVLFTATNGVLAGTGIDITETGTQMAYSAHANIQSPASGTQGVYVAVFAGQQLLFRHDGGWDINPQPLFTFTAPGAVNFDVLRGMDTRSLPSGAVVLVGFGASLDEVVTKNQYRVVRAF